jgi:hypothetical protein
MAKRIALYDWIEIDGVDLSEYARSITLSSEHERVDVSGFTPSGANEYLAGQTEQSVEIEFFGSYATGEVWRTLYPIHRDRDTATFEWRPNQNAAVGPTNPELRGNVQLLTYSPGATRGEAETFTATFTAADSSGLVYFQT